jgi:hypothetical protein
MKAGIKAIHPDNIFMEELWAKKKHVKTALVYVLCANMLMTNQTNRIP